MSEEGRPRRRRIVYYVPDEAKTGEEAPQEEVVTPRPLLIRRQATGLSRPYIFPIIGQIIELLMSILEARRQMFTGQSQQQSMQPKSLVREIVRDESGRVVEERFTQY